MTQRRPRNHTLATFQGIVFRAVGIRADGSVLLCHDDGPPPPSPEFTRYRNSDVNDREFPADSYPANGTVTIFSTAEANPDPTLFTREEREARWVATVGTADCDFVMTVSALAPGKEIHADLIFNEWCRAEFPTS